MKEQERRSENKKQNTSITEATVRHIASKRGSKRLLKSLQKIIRGL